MTELYTIDHIFHWILLAITILSVYGCATDGDPMPAPAMGINRLECITEWSKSCDIHWELMKEGIYYEH